MRILVVNPNTTLSMTEKIGRAAQAVAGRGTEIVAVSPSMGPASIEGYYDEAFAVPGVIDEMRKGKAAGYDGYVIACFDDTGVDAARCVARGPLEEAGAGRLLPRHLDVGDPSRDVDQVERSLADDLIGDVDVAALGVPGPRSSHGTP